MGKGKAGNGEGTIFQRRRDGKWIAELTLGYGADGRRKFTRSIKDTRKQAADWLALQRTNRQEGTLVLPSKDTLAGFLADWLETTVAHEVKPRTVQLYKEMLKYYIVPDLGHIRLKDLGPQDIQAFYHARLKGGLSPRTVQIIHSVLRRGLHQAVRWGLIARSPLDGVSRPRAERPEIKPLEPHQIASFLRAAQDDRLHALFTLAVTAGLRLGELLGLRWSDVDLDAGTLTVAQTMGRVGQAFVFDTPKTRASRRTIDLPTIAVQALRRWRREQAAERLQLGEAWERPDLVFATTVGSPLNPSNVRNRSLHHVLEVAGCPRIRFHDLRHTAATLMLVQGVQPRVLQDVLGHADIRMTLGTYGHVLRQQKKEAAQKVDAFLAALETKAH